MEEAVEIPQDIDAVLKRLLEVRTDDGDSVLAPEDETYLSSLVSAVRAGRGPS